MMCNRCGKPVGMIHRCEPASIQVVIEDIEKMARQALMMNEAGYNVHPVTVKLARAYLELLEKTK